MKICLLKSYKSRKKNGNFKWKEQKEQEFII